MVESTLRELLANGTYPVDHRLPTQRNLANEFGVSRDTIQRVLRKLTQEGWIASRQGSGMRVVKVPVVERAAAPAGRQEAASLGPLIHGAFEQPEVLIDSFALTSETLLSHLRVQAERVLTKAVEPARVRLRILLPAETVELPYPAAREQDDKRVWQRWRNMARRHAVEIGALMAQLRERNVDADAEIRRTSLIPQYKLYVINRRDLLFGLYEPIPRTIALDDGTPVPSWDVLGLGSVLLHYQSNEDPESPNGRVFATAEATFDWYWRHLSDGDIEPWPR
ncbi:winged helix-turn-helix domain-containing protein [Streptomyces sp. NPDC093970]|uniref:winged helix-turn-helix domain-containing protein n=1 Tax=Streptomyces sp. NPDC093970 TaxID=3155076 RepID=UPI003425CAAA